MSRRSEHRSEEREPPPPGGQLTAGRGEGGGGEREEVVLEQEEEQEQDGRCQSGQEPEESLFSIRSKLYFTLAWVGPTEGDGVTTRPNKKKNKKKKPKHFWKKIK